MTLPEIARRRLRSLVVQLGDVFALAEAVLTPASQGTGPSRPRISRGGRGSGCERRGRGSHEVRLGFAPFAGEVLDPEVAAELAGRYARFVGLEVRWVA